MSFWEHLDVLRAVLIRIALVVTLIAAVAFCFKDALFNIVLAPKDDSFITYRLFDKVATFTGDSDAGFEVQLVNTGLARQFIVHVKTAFSIAILLAVPYILYQLFLFIQPALYENERKYALRLVGSGYLMFMTGVAICYFIIFPFTFRFLGTYQVSGDVDNMITLDSYMSTLIMMGITMGVMFELPVVFWLLAKMGIVSSEFMRKYRKHALVIILIAAAIITPTSDIFTLLITSLPIYVLYELSVLIAARTEKSAHPTTASNLKQSF